MDENWGLKILIMKVNIWGRVKGRLIIMIEQCATWRALSCLKIMISIRSFSKASRCSAPSHTNCRRLRFAPLPTVLTNLSHPPITRSLVSFYLTWTALFPAHNYNLRTLITGRSRACFEPTPPMTRPLTTVWIPLSSVEAACVSCTSDATCSGTWFCGFLSVSKRSTVKIQTATC